ncbi:MAG: response regulator [Ignavibacteriales bacterium]|nr:response regulator [Ignavibacteriales bacterium]
MNLCVNARDAILEANRAGKKQSTISLRTWKTDGTELRRKFTSAAAEEYVSISVSDTGVGMEESAMHRVFEPFFTTKEQGKGTGLGLAVVYGVVQSHQGIIDLESKLGTGTTFTLYFPVPKDVSGETALEKKELEEASGGSETVLVIEDEEALRVLLKNLLQAKGYTVITASDGLEGIAVFEENKSKIAMVVSDHGLPGLNGADAVKRMIATKRELKCIIASGYIEPNQKSEIFKSGVKEFIQKPYDPIEVVRKVREVLDSK